MRALARTVCGLLVAGATSWAQNLLMDPGFEDAAQDAKAVWTFTAAAEVVAVPEAAHSGQRCLKARFEDGAAQRMPVEGGATYRIGGWIRRVLEGGTETPKIKVYFLDAKGGRADVQAAAFPDVPAGAWHPWQAVFQAPLVANTMNLTLRGFFGGSEWFYYDDLVVERVEAAGWPDAAALPDLHGRTVTVADIADVWTDALLRIPPASLTPVDGLLGTSVLLRGHDVRVRTHQPFRADWALIHSMRPTVALGHARLLAADAARQGSPARRVLATSTPKHELVTSLRFDATAVREVVLDIPDDAHVHLNEIQLFGVSHTTPLPGTPVACTPCATAPSTTMAESLESAFGAEEHRNAVMVTAGPATPAPSVLPLRRERYLSLLATPGEQGYGLAGLSLHLAMPGGGDDDMVEVTLQRPAELDVSIRWTTASDRGLAPRENRRCYAAALRVVGRVREECLSVTFDVPDLIYAEGEPVWLTVRSRRDVELDLGRTKVTLNLLSPEQARAGYLPQLERLMRRMYSDASEAHVYDNRDWSRMTLGHYVRRVLELDPGNRPATYVHRRIAKVREEIVLERPGPASAPDWAVWAREALRRRDHVIQWWLDNRQQANGELAGHINDDGEFSCNWPSHHLMTGDERVADALRKLADVAWEMSAGTGYTVGSRDVEHAAEDQSCTQPQVLLVDYGNPKAVERLMTMSRYLDFWTAINEAGRRQFKAFMFTTKQIWDEPPFDVDQPYCPLAMVGTGHLLWYTHSPQVAGIFREEAESWALACLSTEGGKRAGLIPKEIHSRDSRINPYAPYPGNPILQKRSPLYRNGAGAYIVRYFIRGAHALDGNESCARVLGLWDAPDEQKREKAQAALRRFTEPLLPPSGPEKRYTVPCTAPTATEAPMRTVRGGQAMGTLPQEEGGAATFALTVGEAGRYAVWGLLGRSDPAENGVQPKTFFVRVDSHPEDRIRIHSPAQEWTPVAASTTYELAAGRHTIAVRARTPGSALKEIGLTTHFSLEGTWRPRQNETTLYDAWRATGDRAWLVGELKEVVRQQIRNHWLLTEAEPYTDRVPLPGRDLLSRMFLGDWTSGKSHVPGHWVSWEGGGLDYAALVLDSGPDRLKALVHSFHERERPMALRVWRLPHGMYDVAVGVDGDGDDQPDGRLRRERMELWRYDGAVPFTAPPGQTLVVELTLLETLEDVRLRPDLAIGPGDVTLTEGALVLTVHNIGASPTPQSAVEVRAADNALLGKATVPALAPPHDLQPKTARIRVPLAGGREPVWVVLDPANAVAEITEANNRVQVR